MLQFFETRMGAKFFDGTMPRIAQALEDIAEGLKQQRWRETVDAAVADKNGRRMLLRKLLDAMEAAGEIEDLKTGGDYTIQDVIESEKLVQEADLVIRIVKSRNTKCGVVYVWRKDVER
jgi:hypothetical protein